MSTKAKYVLKLLVLMKLNAFRDDKSKYDCDLSIRKSHVRNLTSGAQQKSNTRPAVVLPFSFIILPRLEVVQDHAGTVYTAYGFLIMTTHLFFLSHILKNNMCCFKLGPALIMLDLSYIKIFLQFFKL